MPHDFNCSKVNWKKIVALLDRTCPNRKSETKRMLAKIENYKNTDPVNAIMYKNTFVYEPSTPIMQVIIMRAAL